MISIEPMSGSPSSLPRLLSTALLSVSLLSGCGGGGGGDGETPDAGDAVDAGVRPKLINPGDQSGVEDVPGAVPFPEGGVPGTAFEITRTNGALFQGSIALGRDGGQSLLLYTPAANASGESTFTFVLKAEDDAEVFDTISYVLRIAAVNDPPVMDPIASVTLDAGQGASALVTGIGPGGGADEVSQPVTISVDAGDLSFFDVLTVSAPSGGNDAGASRASTLSLQGAAGRTGTVTVTVALDDGEDGGHVEQAFTVTFQ